MVDDDPYISELIADMLRNAGMQEIYLEPDVAHALASIDLHKPDLLICDLALPDTDGIEFLTDLAKLKFPGAVVLFSGMGEPVLRAAQRLATASGLRVLDALVKPMTQTHLQNILTQLTSPAPAPL
jgi:response regulator of citrate/malate metabolism